MTAANVVPLSAAKGAADKGAAQDNGLFQGVIAGLPDKPAGLKPAQSIFWDTFGKKLVDQGLLAEVDLSAFHRYVVAYCEWQELNLECQEKGFTQTFVTGAVQIAPWAVLRDRAAGALLRLEKEFGLTPRARQAIKTDNPNQGDLDL